MLGSILAKMKSVILMSLPPPLTPSIYFVDLVCTVVVIHMGFHGIDIAKFALNIL